MTHKTILSLSTFSSSIPLPRLAFPIARRATVSWLKAGVVRGAATRIRETHSNRIQPVIVRIRCALLRLLSLPRAPFARQTAPALKRIDRRSRGGGSAGENSRLPGAASVLSLIALRRPTRLTKVSPLARLPCRAIAETRGTPIQSMPRILSVPRGEGLGADARARASTSAWKIERTN